MSIDVTFFETTPLSLSSTVTSQGEDDDLLVYIISSPTPALVPIKPPVQSGSSSTGIILLVVYVDDIVITGSDSKSILSLKSFLHSQFHTKNLQMLKYFLCIKVVRSK